MEEGKERYLFFGTAAALFGLSLLWRWLAYSAHEFALGWDSYFYLVQLKSWINEGFMHSPDASLIYPLLRLMYQITGDYIPAFQLTSALLGAAFTTAAFVVVFRGSKSYAPALFIGILIGCSPQLTFFAAQYPKNLLGLTLFLAFVAALSDKKYSWAVVLFMLNLFGHRMTIGLSVLFVLFNFGVLLFFKPKWLKVTLPVSLGLIICSLTLPGLIHWSDFARFENLLTNVPHFSPYSFWQTYNAQLTPLWKAEIIGAVCFYFFILIHALFKIRVKDFSQLPSVLILSLLIFPFLDWSVMGFSFRFLMAFFLLAPVLAGRALPQTNAKWYYATAFTCLMAFAILNQGYRAASLDPPYGIYQKISDRIEQIKQNEQPTLLIGHKALAEYVTFTTGTDVMPWVPEYELKENELWRITNGVEALEFRYFVNGAKVYELYPDYLLVKEADWQSFFKQLKLNDEDFANHLQNWKNPLEVRPYYLHKGKNSD